MVCALLTEEQDHVYTSWYLEFSSMYSTKEMSLQERNMHFFSSYSICLSVYLFLREGGRGRERGGQRICAESREPDARLELTSTRAEEIMTGAEVGCLTD